MLSYAYYTAAISLHGPGMSFFKCSLRGPEYRLGMGPDAGARWDPDAMVVRMAGGLSQRQKEAPFHPYPGFDSDAVLPAFVTQTKRRLLVIGSDEDDCPCPINATRCNMVSSKPMPSMAYEDEADM